MSTPEAIIERLNKTDGHINAIDRHLWRDTGRGLWSGHQAVARLAEAWFLRHGLAATLPPLEKYLPREVMRQRLDDFNRAPTGDVLKGRMGEVAAAEAAILADRSLILWGRIGRP